MNQRVLDLVKRWGEEGETCVVGKELPDGSICVVMAFAYTWGLMYDVVEFDYGGRFCFATLAEAIAGLEMYTGGLTEIPEDCIKPKGNLKKQSYPFQGVFMWPEDGEECKRLQMSNVSNALGEAMRKGVDVGKVDEF